MNLPEKWRPKTLDEVVGQDTVLTSIREKVDREGLTGQAFFFVGKSGCGKTSTARILSDTVQPYFERFEIDAADLNIDTVRDWEAKCKRGCPIGCHGFGFTVNEADTLRGPILRHLLTTLEVPAVVQYSTWFFTCTPAGEQDLFSGMDDAETERALNPFGSRVDTYRFASDEAVVLPFALRLREIAQAESMDGFPLDRYVGLVRQHKSNFRECLRVIGRGEFKA